MVTQLRVRVSRSSWTDEVWKAHYTQQVYRFLRLFVVAFGFQLVAWSQHGVNEHMTWKVLYSLAFAAVEVTWREFFPTTPPATPDPPADTVAPKIAKTASTPHTTPSTTPRKTAKKTTVRRTPRR